MKTGSATLYLSTSANSYSGNTYVNAGTLKALALTSSASDIYVAGGATLQVNYLCAHKLSVGPGGLVVLGGMSGAGAGGDFLGSDFTDSGLGSDTISPLIDTYTPVARQAVT